jgi:hypothetical protein
VLRRIFVPKREEIPGRRRKLHNDEFNGLYYLSFHCSAQSRRMRWAGHVTRMGDEMRAYIPSAYLLNSDGTQELQHRMLQKEQDEESP